MRNDEDGSRLTDGTSNLQRRWPKTLRRKECLKKMPVGTIESHFCADRNRSPFDYTAALALSFSVAKPLLADLQPPIPDDNIRESLWHYFFDVDKAVSYLRKERQKG